MRGLCDYHGNLSVALELSAELEEDEAALLRWLGEPVSTVHVPEALFYRGKSGELKTTRRHERFLVQLFRRGVRMVFEDSKEAGAECLQAIHVLHARRYQISEKEAFESPYYDYLQHPLQPLADHLENSTYETFERDPIKYQQYQEAIRRALCDRADLRPGKHLVVFVLGAGRGPLVKCALRAAGECGRQLKIYALDKNPNAVITLRHLKRVLGWGDAVTVVDSDMRQWDAPEQADIVVSELLGSFGDNELSPECLDGAEACHCFEPQRGISVPSSSTSFLAPVSCVKAWTDVRAYGTRKAFETCYVVKLHQATELAPAQPCFTFAHPNPQKSPNNARYSRLQFRAQATEELHGLVGYFECALYKDVLVSTNPASETPDMTSWFPMYFPVPTPLFVSKGDPIEVHMWRCVSTSIVWYEWCIVTPSATSPILNPNGRSYFIRLH
ncbi:MAG: hypothetical protein Q8P67_24200 [archaeon]|nr:hypothetical protein [archaeon]